MKKVGKSMGKVVKQVTKQAFLKKLLVAIPVYYFVGIVIATLLAGFVIPTWITFLVTMSVSLAILYKGFKASSTELILIGAILMFTTWALAKASVGQMSFIASFINPFG